MAKKYVICDTDVLIDYWNKKSKRHTATKEILEEKLGIDKIIISAITKMELLLGAYNKQEEAEIKKKLTGFNTALFNEKITLKAIDFFEKYHLSHGMAIPDCLIAATASLLGFELFTYNLKDFKFIEDLTLYKI